MDYVTPFVIGLVAGYLAGQFGIGGGFLMQPALRLIIGTPALISLGTPIPVIVISAISGSYNYYRGGFIDMRLAFYLMVSGITGTVLGSLATAIVNGDLILLFTATVLLITSFRFILASRAGTKEAVGGKGKPDTEVESPATEPKNKVALTASVIGAITGFLSGFLGLGGGFLLVPALTIVFKKDIKTALGTSLFVIIAYAIPGAITHYLLGHVNPMLALLMSIGIIPGAYLGSRVAIGLPEIVLRRMFGVFLFSVALYFAIFEVTVLLGA